VSEVAALIPQDVVALGNGGYGLRVQHGKGDKERYAPVLDAQVARELVRFIEGCPERLPIFRISDRTFKWWAQICRLETGIPFHSHRCRHTVGTQLLQKGIPIDKVQEVLGHTDISTTRKYARTAPEDIWKLAVKADRVKEIGAAYRYLLDK